MPPRPTSLPPLVALALAAACEHSSVPPDPALVRTEIDAAMQAQADAWNEGDLEGFMAIYERSEALLFTSGAKVRRGWQATHDSFEQRYFGSDGADRGTLEFELRDVRPVGERGAVVLGHWQLTGTPEAGEGIFSLVFERQHGHWRIVHDHTSSLPPAAGKH